VPRLDGAFQRDFKVAGFASHACHGCADRNPEHCLIKNLKVWRKLLITVETFAPYKDLMA
jgi:hypothetical protein